MTLPARWMETPTAPSIRPNFVRERACLPSRGGIEREPSYARYIWRTTLPTKHPLTRPVSARIARALLCAADGNRLDPRLLTAMIERESSFWPYERSACGARGLGQLTHWEDGGVDVYCIESNLIQSARVLRRHLDEFGSPELALAAYNAGEPRVRKHHRIPPIRETRTHVRVVMATYQRLASPPLPPARRRKNTS